MLSKSAFLDVIPEAYFPRFRTDTDEIVMRDLGDPVFFGDRTFKEEVC